MKLSKATVIQLLKSSRDWSEDFSINSPPDSEKIPRELQHRKILENSTIEDAYTVPCKSQTYSSYGISSLISPIKSVNGSDVNDNSSTLGVNNRNGVSDGHMHELIQECTSGSQISTIRSYVDVVKKSSSMQEKVQRIITTRKKHVGDRTSESQISPMCSTPDVAKKTSSVQDVITARKKHIAGCTSERLPINPMSSTLHDVSTETPTLRNKARKFIATHGLQKNTAAPNNKYTYSSPKNSFSFDHIDAEEKSVKSPSNREIDGFMSPSVSSLHDFSHSSEVFLGHHVELQEYMKEVERSTYANLRLGKDVRPPESPCACKPFDNGGKGIMDQRNESGLHASYEGNAIGKGWPWKAKMDKKDTCPISTSMGLNNKDVGKGRTWDDFSDMEARHRAISTPIAPGDQDVGKGWIWDDFSDMEERRSPISTPIDEKGNEKDRTMDNFLRMAPDDTGIGKGTWGDFLDMDDTEKSFTSHIDTGLDVKQSAALDEGFYGNLIQQHGESEAPNIAKLYRVFMAGERYISEDEAMTNKHMMVAGLNESITNVLLRKGLNPTRLQAFTWPLIAKGSSVIVVGEKSCGKTLGYVVPLLSNILDTRQLLKARLPPGIGPVLVVVCSTWLSAKCAADHVVSVLPPSSTLKIMTAWGGCGRDEEVSTGKQLLTGCDILLTTAPYLLQVLKRDQESMRTTLKRCCHLVFDDVDATLESFPMEVKEILTAWGADRQKCARPDLEMQAVFVSSRWTERLSQLTHTLLPLLEPTVIISPPCEAAIATKVKTHIHFVAHENQALTQVIQLIRDSHSQKRNMVFVRSDHIAGLLEALLNRADVPSVSVDSDTKMWRVQELVRKWHGTAGMTVVVSHGAQASLLPHNLANADALFHTHIGPSFTAFTHRYSFMSANFVTDVTRESTNCESHLVLSKHSLDDFPGVVEELVRICDPNPDVKALLLQSGKGSKHTALCYYLKAYGRCCNRSACTFRHEIEASDIPSHIPRSGEVTFKVVKTLNASRYLVHLMQYRERKECNCIDLSSYYPTLHVALQDYFTEPSNCEPVKIAEPGTLCAIQDSETWVRAQVISVSYKEATPLINAFLIDEGKQVIVNLDSAVILPPHLAAVPQFIVEVLLCRVQPFDRDHDWTAQATNFIYNAFAARKDSRYIGRIVLALGSTVWLNPVAEFIKVDRMFVQKKALREKLITERFGVDNPSHIKDLEELCTKAGVKLEANTVQDQDWRNVLAKTVESIQARRGEEDPHYNKVLDSATSMEGVQAGRVKEEDDQACRSDLAKAVESTKAGRVKDQHRKVLDSLTDMQEGQADRVTEEENQAWRSVLRAAVDSIQAGGGKEDQHSNKVLDSVTDMEGRHASRETEEDNQAWRSILADAIKGAKAGRGKERKLSGTDSSTLNDLGDWVYQPASEAYESRTTRTEYNEQVKLSIPNHNTKHKENEFVPLRNAIRGSEDSHDMSESLLKEYQSHITKESKNAIGVSEKKDSKRRMNTEEKYQALYETEDSCDVSRSLVKDCQNHITLDSKNAVGFSEEKDSKIMRTEEKCQVPCESVDSCDVSESLQKEYQSNDTTECKNDFVFSEGKDYKRRMNIEDMYQAFCENNMELEEENQNITEWKNNLDFTEEQNSKRKLTEEQYQAICKNHMELEGEYQRALTAYRQRAVSPTPSGNSRSKLLAEYKEDIGFSKEEDSNKRDTEEQYQVFKEDQNITECKNDLDFTEEKDSKRRLTEEQYQAIYKSHMELQEGYQRGINTSDQQAECPRPVGSNKCDSPPEFKEDMQFTEEQDTERKELYESHLELQEEYQRGINTSGQQAVSPRSIGSSACELPPGISWWQSEDAVHVVISLPDVEEYQCHFYATRLVFM